MSSDDLETAANEKGHASLFSWRIDQLLCRSDRAATVRGTVAKRWPRIVTRLKFCSAKRSDKRSYNRHYSSNCLVSFVAPFFSCSDGRYPFSFIFFLFSPLQQWFAFVAIQRQFPRPPLQRVYCGDFVVCHSRLLLVTVVQ